MSSEKIPTRTRILQAALEILENNPGTPARMSDIAKAAGVSRQALYLHFPNRTELFIETTRYQDRLNDVDAALAPSRSATSGPARLEAFITAWGNYIPRIYAVAKTLMVMKETDAEAATAWNKRMNNMREGCAAAIDAMQTDGSLRRDMAPDEATDLLWMLLSLPSWEHLTQTSGWSQARYLEQIKDTARRSLMDRAAP